MSPINPNQSIQPSLASDFPDTQARTDAPGESNVQIGNGFINYLTIGNNNIANNHIHLAGADPKLVETLMLQHIFALQSNVEPLVNLDSALEKLREQYLEGLKEDNEVKDALSNYVAPEGMTLYDSTRFDLKSKVQDFLNSDKKVLLLLGEAGSGKSTFNRDLAVSLWEVYTQASAVKNSPIPVFIQLSSSELKSKPNLVERFFEIQGFSKEQIKELQTKHRFVLILDGFDEIRDRQQDFYKDNQLNNWRDAKIIISSRPEYLGSNYQYKFHPSDERSALQEYRLAPFSEETVERYVDQYKRAHPEGPWSIEQYKEALRQGDLKELVRNPFLLKITLSVLPELGEILRKKGQHFTRIALYEHFLRSWFDRSQKRLARIRLSGRESEEFKRLELRGFIERGVAFNKKLAIEMYRAGEVVTTYSYAADDPWEEPSTELSQDWRKRFLGDDNAMAVLVRLNAPLICRDKQDGSGKEYRFIHKSVQDYLVARVLWEELGAHDKMESSSWLNRLNIVNDPAILQFLAERVRQDVALKAQLLRVVERSKGEGGTQFEKGAANAMTILVRAGVQFNRADLNGIRIRGADLSHGVFDYTQFEGADLSEVTLRGAWLRGATMRKANLRNVEFGEMPTLELGGWPNICRYSPDGRWLAVGSALKGCSLYKVEETETELETKIQRRLELKYKWTFNLPLFGTRFVGYSVAFSPDSKWLASADYDGAIRLWSIETGHLTGVFKHGNKMVSSVSFFEKGQWLASGGYDKTVKLWKIQTGKRVVSEPMYTLEAHAGEIESISISSDGKWLASGSKDKTVKLWELKNEEVTLRQTLVEHTDEIHRVSFSGDNKWLACGGQYGAVMLWKLGSTGTLSHQILKGHSGLMRGLSFSPDSSWLASGDDAVKLWKLENSEAVLHHTFEGHSAIVRDVSFSSDGNWLASVSYDKTLKLWELKSDRALLPQMLEGHSGSGKVWSVSVSHNGKWLASGSSDKTIKLWEVGNGDVFLRQTLKEHSGNVLDVTISEDGKWLASGSSDKTVKLWALDSGKAVLHQTLEGHSHGVFGVSISLNNKWLVSSGGKTVRLWELSDTGALLRQTFECHSDNQRRVSVSRDGQWLASGSGSSDGAGSIGNKVELWKLEPESGEKLLYQMLEGHNRDAFSVSFSLDGKWLASGSLDCTVKLWELSDTGASLHQTLKGHRWDILSVAFSPDNKWLASGSFDKTVKLWSLDTGTCKAAIQCFIREIDSIVWQEWTENSAKIVVGGAENMIRIFQLERKGNDWKYNLHWTSYQNELSAGDLVIKDARNLSLNNKRLIERNRKDMNSGISQESVILLNNRLNDARNLGRFFIGLINPSNIVIKNTMPGAFPEKNSIESGVNGSSGLENLSQNELNLSDASGQGIPDLDPIDRAIALREADGWRMNSETSTKSDIDEAFFLAEAGILNWKAL
ncbi:NACHT domain-containing protein [Mycoavidus sp. B2-EB]|uniref:NACHT domain-containing protein n=1 Tax=Mycoavidus sp. B2-EB TaxID=2651972 RepID=UPI0016235A09|nr:NACHT domain-containing protein [Mycoavidus sp. B2-EB]BBO59961.1 hypothetical protein MPB2EB_1093 [Mycoavidus sp. B2-EB]